MPSISDSIRKFFNKSKVIRIFEYCPDTKIRDHYKIPKGNEIVIGNKRYKFAPEHLYMFSKIPTLFVDSASDDAEPIKLYHKHEPIYSAQQYENAISSNVVASFTNAVKEKNTTALAYVVGGVLLIGVAVYIIMNRLDQLQEVITTPDVPETVVNLVAAVFKR